MTFLNHFAGERLIADRSTERCAMEYRAHSTWGKTRRNVFREETKDFQETGENERIARRPCERFRAGIKIVSVKRRLSSSFSPFCHEANNERLAAVSVYDGLRLSYSSPFGRDPTVSQPRHRQGILARFPSDIILDFLTPEISISRAGCEREALSLLSRVSRLHFHHLSRPVFISVSASSSSRGESRDERVKTRERWNVKECITLLGAGGAS